MHIGDLKRDAAGDHPFFAAGIDEQQVLLPVVEEAEVALRVALAGRRRRGRGDGGARFARALDDGGTRDRGPVGLHEAADAVERLGGDAAAVAQPRSELAVIDGAPAEGRFRKSAVPAIVGDFLQQVLRVHGLYASTFRSDLRAPRLGDGLGGGAGTGPQRTKRADVRQPQKVPPRRWEGKWDISQRQKRLILSRNRRGWWAASPEICGVVGNIPQDRGRNPAQAGTRPSSACSTALAIAAVPSPPPNSHGLSPMAKARSTALSMARAACAALSWP